MKAVKFMEIGNFLFGHSRGAYPIDRELFEKITLENFRSLLNVINCDGYGRYRGTNSRFRTLLGGFGCNLFEINPYYWGDCDCDANAKETHKDYCSLSIPNFKYRTNTGEVIEIRWYKYPFRDSYSNVELSAEMFASIISDCANYVKNLNI